MTYVNSFRNRVINLLNGQVEDIAVDFMELGTGTSLVDPTNTSLQAPFFRKAVSKKKKETDLFETITSILAAEAISSDINEIGFFTGGSLTLGSGQLLARIHLNTTIIKTTGNVLNVVRRDNILLT